MPFGCRLSYAPLAAPHADHLRRKACENALPVCELESRWEPRDQWPNGTSAVGERTYGRHREIDAIDPKRSSKLRRQWGVMDRKPRQVYRDLVYLLEPEQTRSVAATPTGLQPRGGQ
jgi:hypothetical protein